MLHRNKTLFLIICAVFVLWNGVTYFYITDRSQLKITESEKLIGKLSKLEVQLSQQSQLHAQILDQLRLEQKAALDKLFAEGARKDDKTGVARDSRGGPDMAGGRSSHHIIAVLVMGCNRVTVNLNLDQLLKFRPSAEKFPIIVSLDCNHQPTEHVVKQYGDKIKAIIKHPDQSEIKVAPKIRKFVGYYKIARHYKWALNKVFTHFNYSSAIIVEDDLNISPDFFEYFEATHSLLLNDPNLWCVSAWNDNGKSNLVNLNQPELLYRTDFFPGLGWMLSRQTWLELAPTWPETFWDDWMRMPVQRKSRECIRPEISRTSTFGKVGVSKGQYFDKILKHIRHNEKKVKFTQLDLSFLNKDKYDEIFVKTVYSSPLVSLDNLVNNQLPPLPPEESAVAAANAGGHNPAAAAAAASLLTRPVYLPSIGFRLEYTSKASFKVIAKKLGIMDDFKSGVPRQGYRGVVSFMFNGHRVYLAPPATWTKYDVTWT